MDYRVPNIFGKIKNTKISVSVPGSKSITARALLLAALAKGESTLLNAQFSDDCLDFANCLKALGISVEISGTTVKVKGCGGKLPVKEGSINVGSAGTAARFITAMLAFQKGRFFVDSSAQMKNRPIAPLISALQSAGAKFEFTENENCFPFYISGGADSGEIGVDISQSSQFLSAVIMASVCADRTVKITPRGSHGLGYVNMTLDMMWSFGVTVREEGGSFLVDGGYVGKRYEIEPDLSAACYFYAANKILGTEISVNGILPHSMQSDAQFIELLKNFDGGRVDMSAFSDQALTLAAIAPYLDKPTEICGARHIRKQECDRISAIVKNLTAMGVKCEEREDGVKIYPAEPKPAKIETFGDHRVAMSFALTGLRADGIVIKDAEVCSKTFKNYFEVLDGAVQKLTARRSK